MKILLEIVVSKEIIAAIIGALIPILIGGIKILYNAIWPGLRFLTKRDYSVARYLCFMIVGWTISVIGATSSILTRQESDAATKNGFFVVCGACVVLAFLSYIVLVPKRRKYSIILGIAPIVSGIGMGYGSRLDNATMIYGFGAILIGAELIGMIYYDKTLVIHKHKYAHLKSVDGSTINCKCRDMKFHGFKQIVEIKQTGVEITTLIPYSQIVKIQYEGEMDEVENTESIRYTIMTGFEWVKNRMAHRKSLKITR